jgi:SAM-dependent methyltransferase
MSRDPVKYFLQALEAYIGPDSVLLDIGAGAGKSAYALKGRVKRIVGVDLDPRVRDNPLLDEGFVATAARLPFPAGSFDIVFSIYVLEHIQDPGRFVNEIRRVLRPGGFFLALTPNRYHYVSLLATMTPTSFHKRVNHMRGRAEQDTFPTVYRMNTRRRLSRLFRDGFICALISQREFRPNYLTFWTPAFLLGAMYERIVNRFGLFADLRVNIVCVFQKALD